ncbi:MAG: hypothetical protein IKI74_04990 [Christensenellaceae bacterium]|nr:hypothetical protein [Christensenellaceae bacterium]
MIRKSIVLILAVLAAMLVFASCKPAKESEEQLSPDSFKTFADISSALPEEKWTWQLNGTTVGYMFELNGKYYRALSEIDEETADKILELTFGNEEDMKESEKMVSAIEIGNVEDITDDLLTKDEMAQYKGKKGQVFFDEDWEEQGYMLESMVFYLSHGHFLYSVTFEGSVPESEWDSFEYGNIADFTVKSVELQTMGPNIID